MSTPTGRSAASIAATWSSMPSWATNSRVARPISTCAATTAGASSATPLLGPRSPGAVRLEPQALRRHRRVGGNSLPGVARAGSIGARVVLARRARERRSRRADGGSRLRAGRRARALRHGAAERVLRQPVRRSHAAAARSARRRAGGAAKPRRRRPPPVARHRVAAARRKLLHRRDPAARPGHTIRRAARGAASRAPAGRALAARAFDGRAAGRTGVPRGRRARAARLLRVVRGRSSGCQRAGRPGLRRSRAEPA